MVYAHLCVWMCPPVWSIELRRARQCAPEARPLSTRRQQIQQSRLQAPQGWGCRLVPDAWFIPASLDLTSSADCTASSLCRAISVDPKSSLTHKFCSTPKEVWVSHLTLAPLSRAPCPSPFIFSDPKPGPPEAFSSWTPQTELTPDP